MEGAFCLGILGIVFLIIDIHCIIKMIEYYSLKKNGVCCSGKVIRRDKTFSRAGYVYTPWYEYTTETGEYFCKMCQSSTSFKNAFPVGRKIKIYYDKNDPENHIIDKNTLYTQAALTIITSVLFLVTGGVSISMIIGIIK